MVLAEPMADILRRFATLSIRCRPEVPGGEREISVEEEFDREDDNHHRHGVADEAVAFLHRDLRSRHGGGQPGAEKRSRHSGYGDEKGEGCREDTVGVKLRRGEEALQEYGETVGPIATVGGRPMKMRSGRVRKEPPPARVLMKPAKAPATSRRTAWTAGESSMDHVISPHREAGKGG